MLCTEQLLPRPRHIQHCEGICVLEVPGCIVPCVSAEKGCAWLLKRLGMAWQSGVGVAIRCARDAQYAAQAYRVRVMPYEIVLEAADEAGFFYAAVTLSKLIEFGQGRLPCCVIDDAPDFPVRGVMLDVSRDKVPTLETLYGLIDRFAELKLNHLQLYMEHTFAYRGHEEVWADASPFTGDEIRMLDRYCGERCIELVPNQNSLGHLEQWFAHSRYLELAELPQGGAPLPWGGFQEKPSCLSPSDPQSLVFLEGLYDQLLPCFTSRLFNVGGDEPFDLRGPGKSAARVKAVGEGRVYFDFMLELYQRVKARGFQMAFWGDIIINHPELIPEIPHDVVVLEWGYEADHPFDAHGARFAAAGVPFYVCPGTASWNALSGRADTAEANLKSAARHGLKHGACGMIVCDWGDGGHWQPLAISYVPFARAAAYSWGLAQNEALDIPARADGYLTQGFGRILDTLGRVHLLSGATRGNSTELFHILSKPRSRPLLAGITLDSLQAVDAAVSQIEKAVAGVRAATVDEARIVRAEILHACRLVHAACQRGTVIIAKRDDPDWHKTVAQIKAAHEQVWRLRNRTGGLADSLARFEKID